MLFRQGAQPRREMQSLAPSLIFCSISAGSVLQFQLHIVAFGWKRLRYSWKMSPNLQKSELVVGMSQFVLATSLEVKEGEEGD